MRASFLLLRALLALAFATVGMGQTTPAVAVFTDLSPTIKRMAIGNSHVTLWMHLAGASTSVFVWDAEIACYEDNGNGVVFVSQIQVQPPGQTMKGECDTPDGQFWWSVMPNGDGTTFWFMGGMPAGCGAFDVPCVGEVIQEGTI